MKRYLSLSIIRKLPLFVIVSVLFLTAAFFSTASADFSRKDYFTYPDACLPALLVFFFITMMILPLFSMNYRYSLARSDLYRQVGFKNNTIRIGEHLSSLIIVCISFTISFAMLVSILLIKNYTVEGLVAYYLHYEWYIVLYFVSIILGVGQYFLSYLLVSRSNTFINSLLMLLLGQFFLNFFIYVFVCFGKCSISEGTMFTQGPSVIGLISWVPNIIDQLICSNQLDILDGTDNAYRTMQLTAIWLSIIIFFLVAALGVVAFILEKDPSSEWAGKPDTPKPYQEIIFHAGFATIGLVIGTTLIDSTLTLVYSLLYFSTYVIAYYTLYGLLRRNFKLNARQAAIIFGISGFAIVFSVAYSIISFYVRLQYAV